MCECVREGEREKESVCVCEREGKREKVSFYVHVCV